MFMRQAFQTFLLLQSESDRRPADADREATANPAAWPMDHADRTEGRDWTLDWRWFTSEDAR
ncbi:hypothetical protein [Reyranella sp.]|uniref:hypothetical protein n=1 Tax=Reyranella sp. TaxID=1929291 RepID=UPI003BA9895F